MTGFALGDKFIGVSTDNIYTKQELDTKLQDKQDTLIAGQGIDISEDGTISVDVTSAGFGLGAQAPLQYTSAQYATSVEINKEAGTFTRKLTLPSTSARETPYKGQGLNNTKWYLTGTYNSDNQTVTIDTAQTLYAECPTTSNVTFRFDPPFNNDTSYGSRACVIFGYKDENGNITHLGNVTYTVSTTTHTLHGGYQTVSSLVSKGGISTQKSNGISEMVIDFDQHLENLSTNQIPTENFYIILRAYRQGSTGNQMYYICFKDATTDETIYNEGFMVSEQMPDLNFFCLSTTDDVAYPITGRARVVGDDRPNEYVWTVKDGVSPNTLKLNYDGSLTLDSSNNLKVNVENLGLATVATTGSYMDLTNTPEEYVLPTASTDTLGGVKVDGTSIVIADGVISTNTGTGVDTYTKVEVNNLLSAKQDTITPSSPLSITKEVRSNLEGFQYTTDSTGVYTTGNYYWSVFNVPLTFTISSGALPGDTLNPETFSNKIVIPYSLGQVVKVPTAKSLSSLNPYTNYIFGKLLQDGTFVPIVNWHINPSYLIMKDTPSAYGGTYGNTLQLSYADTGLQNPTASEQITTGSIDITFSLIQMREDVDGSIWVDIDNGYVYGVFQQNQVQKYQYHYTNTEYVNRLKEINSCILAPVSNNGMDVNNAIQVEDIGLYPNPGNLYNLITSENYNNIDLGENLFDLSGEQAYNYLDLNIDNTLKINENSQLSVNTDSFATSEDLANKLDITKCTDIPVGLEHSISDGVLSVQTGYVKSAKGQLEVTEPLTTADISNVQTGADNGVILGDVTTQRTLEINENTGKYLFFAGTDANQQNNMVEDNRGSWIFASSSQGKNSTTCPYYGFIFNEEQPAGNYSVTINIISGWINISLAKGTIGNLTNLNTDTSSAGIKTFDFEVSEPFSTIYVYYGNYYNFQVAYDCKITQTVSATEFSTYLCVKDGTQSIKLLNDTTELASYTDYAKIGKVIYDVTLANPTAFPSQDLANKYLSGGLEVPSLDNVITNKTLKNYIKQGDNVTITPESDGSLTISSTGGTVGDNVITSDNISQNEYIKQLEARIAALETALDGGNSLGEIITNTVIQTAGTPAGGQNSGYVGTQTITVQDLETS